MKEFKYYLRKGSKKDLCPKCNKKTYVPYLETDTGNYIDAGRCDREQNCGYHKKPESNDIVFITKEIIKKETNYIPLSVLENYYLKENTNNFIKFLQSIFTKEQVKVAEQLYFISDKGNQVIFWQIDQLERVRSGKIMDYNSTTGKRIKDENGKAHINWIHKQPYNLKQCLFGLHLIKEDKIKTIAIVESEKTAILMSIYVPEFLWLATGSKSGFKIEYISEIKSRKIICFPDKGCFKEWNEKVLEMNNFGYSITISDIIEKSDCEDGLDIADLYLKL